MGLSYENELYISELSLFLLFVILLFLRRGIPKGRKRCYVVRLNVSIRARKELVLLLINCSVEG